MFGSTRLFFALFLLLHCSSAFSAESIYDLGFSYNNPLHDLDPDCKQRVDYFRISRPILPLVNHIVVGARIQIYCSDRNEELLRVYGASKGNGDMDFFQAELHSEKNSLRYLGSNEGERALQSLENAVRISKSWNQKLLRNWYFYGRMITTPLFGRICAAAAEDVMEALALD